MKSVDEISANILNLKVLDHQSQTITLSTLWLKRHVLFFLMKSVNCTFCIEHLLASNLYLDALKEHQTSLIIIIDQSIEQVPAQIKNLKTSLEIYSDPQFHTYNFFGMHNTHLVDRLTPRFQGSANYKTLHSQPHSLSGGFALMSQGQRTPAWTYIAQPCQNYPTWQSIVHVAKGCYTSFLRHQS